MEKNISQIKDNIKYEKINIVFLTPVVLCMVALLIFQFSHLIICIWNIVPVLIVGFIYFNCIKQLFDHKKELKVTENHNTVYETEQNTFSTLDKKSVKFKKSPLFIIELITLVICISLSVLFFSLYSNKSKNLTVVTATVESQNGETIVETEYDEFEDTEIEKESSYCKLNISYNFNGTKHFETLQINTTDKVYSKTIKIYVNQNGSLITSYGKIEIFKWLAITMIVLSIIILLYIIFKLSLEFISLTFISLIGFVVLFCGNMDCIQDIFYNVITTFSLMFLGLGLSGILSATAHKLLIKDTPNDINKTPQPTTIEDKITNTKQRLSRFRCKYCDAVLDKKSNVCPICGAPKNNNKIIEK